MLGSLVAATPAAAEDPAKVVKVAQKYVALGEDLFRLGNYPEAVENFLRAWERARRSADPAAVLQTEYLDRASLGLQMFIFK